MTNKNAPAFPVYHGGNARSDDDGMTLRDYFAAKAMAAFILATVHLNPDEVADAVAKQGHDDAFGLTAHFGYKQADAMLKAREE